jgi:hypothetical protein
MNFCRKVRCLPVAAALPVRLIFLSTGEFGHRKNFGV